MLSIQSPEDVVSISMHTILSSRINDPEFNELVINWNKKIVVDIEPFYPLTITFEGNEVKFKIGDLKKADLKIRVHVKHLLDMAYGRLSLIMAVLTRKLRIKGIYKIGTLLKFYRIIFKTMKMVAANPNNNYFEQNKEIR